MDLTDARYVPYVMHFPAKSKKKVSSKYHLTREVLHSCIVCLGILKGLG